MGGSSPKPPPPSGDKLALAQLQMQSTLGQQALANENNLLRMASTIPLETWTPDIFGQQGALTQTGQIAAINAFKSKELEKQTNPSGAIAREAVNKSAEDYVSPDYWKKQMEEWSRTKGLQNYLGTGLQDSTIGKSGYFDEGTLQGQAFKDANLAKAMGIIGNAPVAGIDPAQAIAAQQAALTQGMQQRSSFRNSMLGNAQANNQSTTDWINQMMGSTSQAVNAHNQNWQNYQQAVMNAGAQNQASKNAMIGSGAAAGGTALLAGAIII
jgi:hypothetical protein